MDVVIITMLFGVLGIVIGWKVGSVWGGTARDNRQYWLRNVAVVLVGIVASSFIAATGLITLVGLGIGLIGGAVAGLKMGYGKSVGAWQKHDAFFRVNKDQVKAAKSAEAAKQAGRTPQEQASRDLVSVDGSADNANQEKGH